jgi:hypothetical protein
MWHLGLANVMFAEDSTKDIIWDPSTSTFIGCTIYPSDDENDHDWTPSCEGDSSDSAEDSEDYIASDAGYESEDLSWCVNAYTLNTWDHRSRLGAKASKRKKFQQRPLVQ